MSSNRDNVCKTVVKEEWASWGRREKNILMQPNLESFLSIWMSVIKNINDFQCLVIDSKTRVGFMGKSLLSCGFLLNFLRSKKHWNWLFTFTLCSGLPQILLWQFFKENCWLVLVFQKDRCNIHIYIHINKPILMKNFQIYTRQDSIFKNLCALNRNIVPDLTLLQRKLPEQQQKFCEVELEIRPLTNFLG